MSNALSERRKLSTRLLTQGEYPQKDVFRQISEQLGVAFEAQTIDGKRVAIAVDSDARTFKMRVGNDWVDIGTPSVATSVTSTTRLIWGAGSGAITVPFVFNENVTINADLAITGTVDGVDVSAIPSTYLPVAGGAMSGNITMVGAQTVDGVDVSAIPSTYAPLASPTFTGTPIFNTNALTVGLEAAGPFLISPRATSGSTILIKPASADPTVIVELQSYYGTQKFTIDKYGVCFAAGGFDFGTYSAGFGRIFTSGWPKSGDTSIWIDGQPAYIDAANHVALAKADALATSDVVGVSDYCTSGAATLCHLGIVYPLEGWASVTEDASATLDPGQTYYLSAATAGKITKVKPTGAGTFVKKIGVAINTTRMWADCGGPVIANGVTVTKTLMDGDGSTLWECVFTDGILQSMTDVT